jgi:VanZ family protein
MASLSRFGPPAALMALIFFLSAQPHLSSGLGTWDLVLRKLAHMTEYAALFLLWRRALPRLSPWAAFGICLGYACSDELHQTFVSGRHGAPVDVLIDTAGMGFGWAATRLLAHRRAG